MLALNTKLRVLFLLLTIFLCSWQISCSKRNRETPYNQTIFTDGYDWNYITSLKIPEEEKFILKQMLVNSILQSGIFNDQPVIQVKEPLRGYIFHLDLVYAKRSNLKVPIFFALKMAEMYKDDIPDQRINVFRDNVLKKVLALEEKNQRQF